MDFLWNFNSGIPIPPQETQFNDSSWVPVMQPPPPSNWPEMDPVSSGYLHEIPNPNVAHDKGVWGFDLDLGHQRGNPVPMPYQQDMGIEGLYPNGSLSDILASGDAGYTPAMEKNLKRIIPIDPILDLNFPADSSVWPEFDSGCVVLPSQSTNPVSSLITDDYSGQSNHFSVL